MNDWKSLFTAFPAGSTPQMFREELELLVREVSAALANDGAGRSDRTSCSILFSVSAHRQSAV